MENTSKRRGRPPGTFRSLFVSSRSLRYTAADLAAVKALAALWHTTEAEATRRAIRETCLREQRRGGA